MTTDSLPRVLVLDVTPDLPGGTEPLLAPHFGVVACVGVEDLTYRLHRERVDAVAIDARHDVLEAPDILAAIRAKARTGADLPVLVIVPEATTESQANDLLRAGAHDLVSVELVDPLLVHRLRRLLRTRVLMAIQAEWEAGERRARDAFEAAAAEQCHVDQPSTSGLLLGAHTMACPAYAGDFALGFVAGPDRHVLAIGDVLGVGALALARAAAVRGAVAACARACATPAEALTAANHVVCSLVGADAYARVWLAFIDPTTGALAFSHAGQPGFVVQEAAEAKSRWLLAPGGPPLGADPDSAYEDGRGVMGARGRLLVGTPGAIVAHRGEELESSMGRLAELVDSVRDDKFEVAWRLVWSRVAGFHQQSTETRDVTLLFVERTAS